MILKYMNIFKNKGMIGVIVVFILFMFLYSFFFKEAVDPSSTANASAVGDDLVKLYSNLKQVTLDQSVFSSKGYLLLSDFSVVIPQQPVGRPNPFNTIGRD